MINKDEKRTLIPHKQKNKTLFKAFTPRRNSLLVSFANIWPSWWQYIHLNQLTIIALMGILHTVTLWSSVSYICRESADASLNLGTRMQNSCLHSNLVCGVLVKIQEGGKDERKSGGTPINPCKEMLHTFPCVQLHWKQIWQKCPWESGVLAVDMWRWRINCEVCTSPELHACICRKYEQTPSSSPKYMKPQQLQPTLSPWVSLLTSACCTAVLYQYSYHIMKYSNLYR